MKPRAFNPYITRITALAALIAAPLAHAQSGTWNGISGNWTDTAVSGGVWSGGTIATGIDSNANFTGVDIAADRTISLNGTNRTIGNITFTDATNSSNNLSITGNTLTLDRTTGVPIIDVTQANRALTITSIVAGSDGLQKNGPGTLILSAANTFTGGLTVKAGVVQSGAGVSFLGSSAVTIGDSANTGAAAGLNFTSGNTAFSNAINVVGNGANTLTVFGFNPTFSGAISLSSNFNVVSNNGGGSNIGISGGITGTGNLVLQSNAANSASSAITISGSTLNFTGTITNSGTTTSTTASNTTISAVIGPNVTGITQSSTNSQLTLSGNNTFTSNVAVSAGTLNVTGVRTGAATSGALGNPTTANRTVTISNGSTLNFTSNDVMGDGGSAPALTIIANGGFIRNGVSGINSLGPMQLNGGTLNSNGSGAGFKLTGTVTVGGSALSQIISGGSIVSSGLITYDVADAVAGSGNDLNVTAVVADIFGAGGIIKTGAGTMTLTAQNTYTGLTRIDNGTLALANTSNNALPNAAAVNVNGGILALSTFTETVGAITLTSGSITGSGAGRLTGSSYGVQSGTISAKLGGAGALTKTTTGTVTISSDNTGVGGYTGAVAVNQGTLLINGNISTSITTVASTATLGGAGTVGALTVQSGGFVTPGNSPGILTVNGNYIQAGQYTAEIAGTTAGNSSNNHDQINVTGTVNITGGTLVTQFSAGTYALNNLIFILLNDSTEAITGIYTGLAQDAVVATFGGFDWKISYIANGNNTGSPSFTGGNDIALMAVPEPNVAALLGALGGIMLLRRRR